MHTNGMSVLSFAKHHDGERKSRPVGVLAVRSLRRDVESRSASDLREQVQLRPAVYVRIGAARCSASSGRDIVLDPTEGTGGWFVVRKPAPLRFFKECLIAP